MSSEQTATGGTSYVAFLRAINLGARRKFPKADIIAATEAAGCTDVQTHINTGNVLLTTTLGSREELERVLEEAYADRAGFDVPTIAFPIEELARVAADAEELNGTRGGLERHYVYLLKSEPAPEAVAAVQERSAEQQEVVVRGRAAHVLLGPGYQQGRVDPYRVEKTLGVVATNRNFNVVTTLAQKWCS